MVSAVRWWDELLHQSQLGTTTSPWQEEAYSSVQTSTVPDLPNDRTKAYVYLHQTLYMSSIQLTWALYNRYQLHTAYRSGIQHTQAIYCTHKQWSTYTSTVQHAWIVKQHTLAMYITYKHCTVCMNAIQYAWKSTAYMSALQHVYVNVSVLFISSIQYPWILYGLHDCIIAYVIVDCLK